MADQLSRLCPKAPISPIRKLTQLATSNQTVVEDAEISVAIPVLTPAAPTIPEVVGTHTDNKEKDIDDGDHLDNDDYEVDVAGRVSSFVRNKPTKRQYRAISAVHNSIAGHQGVKNTMAKLKQQEIHWEYMRRHVECFIRYCPECQELSQVKPNNISHQFTASSYWSTDRLAIDFAGPHDDGGYVLLVIDTFSRWVELFHTTAATAETTMHCLLQIVGRYGAPLQILSDRGSHFVNDVIECLLKLIGTQHCLTIAYSKEENTMAERAIKEAKRHIRAMVNDVTSDERDYKQYLPLVPSTFVITKLLVHRCTSSTTTRYRYLHTYPIFRIFNILISVYKN